MNLIKEKIENTFRKKVQKDKNIENAYFLIDSEDDDFHMNIAEGKNSDPNQQFFIASVGKFFTATLIAMAEEKNIISYDDYIYKYLDESTIENLHVYKNTDYSKKLKIKHLLNHSSGIHDYFDDKPENGKKFLDLVVEFPYERRDPKDLINWSKKNLKSHFEPGKKLHYSDTGYLLLGLILENIHDKPLYYILEEEIFKPLNMKNTFLATHDYPYKENGLPIAKVLMGDKVMNDYSVLKDDFSGGGMISTTEDLLKFMKAFFKFNLISKNSFEKMKDFKNFSVGIKYGYGIMNFHTIPLLFPKKFNCYGNIGIIGAAMFYFPESNIYSVINLNNFRYHSKSIRMMFSLVNILLKNRK